MPAEWESHHAMWLALPHDEEEWGDYFEEAHSAVRTLANVIATSEHVHLLVSPNRAPTDLHDNITCHQIPFGDIWLRDTGPVFVMRGDEVWAAQFAFNGWGGKYVFEHDSEVATRIAALANVPISSSTLVAEGGGLDCNGRGTFLSTRECLLNDNRNPALSETDVEEALAKALGCKKLIWLDQGLVGDHTDGHVDNVARFVGPNTVVCMSPLGSSDPNAAVLSEIKHALESATTAEGAALEVITIPSPGPIAGPLGPMAASYCNFLIANSCVVVPTFGVASDAQALATMGKLFPNRRIVPLHAYALLTGGGTLHCISQQEPSHV